MAAQKPAEAIPVISDDPGVETGQLPDERQVVAAIVRLDGGWMAVVHFFSADGDHVDTEHSAIYDGSGAPPDAVTGELEQMLRRLEPYRTDAVTVAPFEVEVAGHTLGLSSDRDGGGLRLEPDGPRLVPASGS